MKKRKNPFDHIKQIQSDERQGIFNQPPGGSPQSLPGQNPGPGGQSSQQVNPGGGNIWGSAGGGLDTDAGQWSWPQPPVGGGGTAPGVSQAGTWGNEASGNFGSIYNQGGQGMANPNPGSGNEWGASGGGLDTDPGQYSWDQPNPNTDEDIGEAPIGGGQCIDLQGGAIDCGGCPPGAIIASPGACGPGAPVAEPQAAGKY